MIKHIKVATTVFNLDFQALKSKPFKLFFKDIISSGLAIVNLHIQY